MPGSASSSPSYQLLVKYFRPSLGVSRGRIHPADTVPAWVRGHHHSRGRPSMLGPAKRRSLGLPVTVSLEALVPADHFYRHLDATLDRSFVREWAAAYVERVKGYVGTEAFKKAMRKRQVWVEPLFGEAKQWHNLRQFRLRRLWRVNCEVLLVAAGQYLK